MPYCVGKWYVPIRFEEKYAYADNKSARNNQLESAVQFGIIQIKTGNITNK